MKTCSKCHIEKDIAEFKHRSDKPHLYRSHCSTCIREKARSPQDRARANLRRKVRYHNDAEYKAKVLSYMQYRWQHYGEEMYRKHKVWVNNNLDKVRMYSRYYRAHRRAAERLATPVWADLAAIRDIYKDCPKGYHVDHIVPLQGKHVCGLHVPCNLQYLIASENLKKGNTFR